MRISDWSSDVCSSDLMAVGETDEAVGNPDAQAIGHAASIANPRGLRLAGGDSDRGLFGQQACRAAALLHCSNLLDRVPARPASSLLQCNIAPGLSASSPSAPSATPLFNPPPASELSSDENTLRVNSLRKRQHRR